jgi:hypothetical protein
MDFYIPSPTREHSRYREEWAITNTFLSLGIVGNGLRFLRLERQILEQASREGAAAHVAGAQQTPDSPKIRRLG